MAKPDIFSNYRKEEMSKSYLQNLIRCPLISLRNLRELTTLAPPEKINLSNIRLIANSLSKRCRHADYNQSYTLIWLELHFVAKEKALSSA